jgi:hypothetical protein
MKKTTRIAMALSMPSLLASRAEGSSRSRRGAGEEIKEGRSAANVPIVEDRDIGRETRSARR